MPSLLVREVTCNLLRVSSGILAGLMEITSARKSTVQLPKAEPTHISLFVAIASLLVMCVTVVGIFFAEINIPCYFPSFP